MLKLLYPPVFKVPIRGDPVGNLERQLVSESENVGNIRW